MIFGFFYRYFAKLICFNFACHLLILLLFILYYFVKKDLRTLFGIIIVWCVYFI